MISQAEETVQVDPSEFRREWHNYSRFMLGIAATCLLAFVGSFISNLEWQARTDEKINGIDSRFVNQTAIDDTQNRQIESLNTFQAQINGRLGVIEERTSNTLDGLKRIETKLDKK